MSPSGIDIIELNEITNSSNFEKVRQQLRSYVFINYKTLGDCIHSLQLDDPEEFEMPEELEDLDPENDKGGLKAHLLKKQIQRQKDARYGTFVTIRCPVVYPIAFFTTASFFCVKLRRDIRRNEQFLSMEVNLLSSHSGR